MSNFRMRCGDMGRYVVFLGILGLLAPRAAEAAMTMNCAAAMSLIADHPGIEASSLLSDVAAEWRAMDQQTVSGGHPALVSRMLTMPEVMTLLSSQCADNPGQPLQAAAGQVYLRMRATLDGF
jgi:hypothetical protein